MTIATVTPRLVSKTSSEITESDIKKELSKIKQLPTPVSHWEVNFGFDHADDPAVYVLATVQDDDIENEKVRFNKRLQTRSIIYKQVAEKVNPEDFIYINFRMLSDIH